MPPSEIPSDAGGSSTRSPFTEPCIILSGGPRSRRVYFETDFLWEQAQARDAGRTGSWDYVDAGRSIAVSEVYKWLPDRKLEGLTVKVFVWRSLADTTPAYR